jgi:hypothetical protein
LNLTERQLEHFSRTTRVSALLLLLPVVVVVGLIVLGFAGIGARSQRIKAFECGNDEAAQDRRSTFTSGALSAPLSWSFMFS